MKRILIIWCIISSSFKCAQKKCFYVVCEQINDKQCQVNYLWKENDSLSVSSFLNIYGRCEELRYDVFRGLEVKNYEKYETHPYYKFVYKKGVAYLGSINQVNTVIYDSMKFVKKESIFRIDSTTINKFHDSSSYVLSESEPLYTKFKEGETFFIFRIRSKMIRSPYKEFDNLVDTSYYAFNKNFGYIPYRDSGKFSKLKFLTLCESKK